MARVLVADMPCTLAALARGVLSECRAEIITKEATCLSAVDRRRLDTELCGDPARLEGMGDTRLRSEAGRIALRLDRESVLDKGHQGPGDRTVTFRLARDGMAYITALLPAQEGRAVYQTVSRDAAALVGTEQGAARKRGQIMADLVVERVTGRNPVTDPVPVAVSLVLSDDTLLAGGPEPAHLTGYGPIPATLARHLIERAVLDDHTEASLRRLYAQPATGNLVAMESRSRTFPTGLARFIATRDQTCRTPYCNAPIRHLDHIAAHTHSGPTTAHNGQGLCEHCNYVKEEPGWHSRTTYDRYGRHSTELTTPTGAIYTSTAPPMPTGLQILTRRVHLAIIEKGSRPRILRD